MYKKRLNQVNFKMEKIQDKVDKIEKRYNKFNNFVQKNQEK